ncbi:hypothetical protein D9756_003611 [Leucocoprinus leucothites]|uniref:Aldose 1-epimerase n=1 Tax=Leucocoprinus leucothites TaxID=201217 RepID=A0A8H5G7L3_9AGAR|nr:hypothetical protein D9756_003611 [Leucoagaricus leucothites]
MRSLPGDSYALFSLVSPHGDQGYPGELLTEVLVSLVPSSAGKLGSVVIVYRCRLNGREKVVTSVNLTQHWGFNLEASLSGGKQLEAASVKEHELMIGADYIANLDGYYLPTGEYTPVSIRPSHDFWEPSLIGKFPTSGYNDYFLFDDSLVYPSPRRAGLSDLQSLNLLDDILNHDDIGGPPSVRLESKKAGIALQFFSNQRGVMFYSNFLAEPNNGARKNIHGGSGVTGEGDSYSPWTAAFLEFHEPLAAFLRPENRDGEDTLLASGELYNNFVRLEIEQIARP